MYVRRQLGHGVPYASRCYYIRVHGSRWTHRQYGENLLLVLARLASVRPPLIFVARPDRGSRNVPSAVSYARTDRTGAGWTSWLPSWICGACWYGAAAGVDGREWLCIRDPVSGLKATAGGCCTEPGLTAGGAWLTGNSDDEAGGGGAGRASWEGRARVSTAADDPFRIRVRWSSRLQRRQTPSHGHVEHQ